MQFFMLLTIPDEFLQLLVGPRERVRLSLGSQVTCCEGHRQWGSRKAAAGRGVHGGPAPPGEALLPACPVGTHFSRGGTLTELDPQVRDKAPVGVTGKGFILAVRVAACSRVGARRPRQ